MQVHKTNLFKYIYWRKKANKYKNLYETEMESDNARKEELERVYAKYTDLLEKKADQDKILKELKQRVSEIEEIVKNKKKVK